MRRSDLALTPLERIAARMREIIVESYEKEKHNSALRFPGIPDVADLAEGISLELQRELTRAQIDGAESARHCGYTFIEEQQRELDRLNLEIAKRNHPTK